MEYSKLEKPRASIKLSEAKAISCTTLKCSIPVYQSSCTQNHNQNNNINQQVLPLKFMEKYCQMD